MRKIYFLLLFLMLLPYVAVAQDTQEGYAIDYAAETISVTKSDAELGGLTVSGQTGF